MADSLVDSEFRPKCFDEKVIINDKSESEFSFNMKSELQILREELSSARLIIKLLQTEGNAVNAVDISTNRGTNKDARNEGKTVPTNRHGASRPTTVQQPQPIPTIINRYKVLDNLHIQPPTHQQQNHVSSLPTAKKEHSRATHSVSTVQQTKGSENNNKKTQAKKRNKIIIIGDSHARGCALDIRHTWVDPKFSGLTL